MAMDCLALGLRPTLPTGKLKVVDFSKCSQTGPTPILGTNEVLYKLNSDDDNGTQLYLQGFSQWLLLQLLGNTIPHSGDHGWIDCLR